MTAHAAQLVRLRAALHAPTCVPAGAGWNAAELADLLPAHGDRTPAAVLVGLVPRAGAFNVLLTVRNVDLRHHAGQVSFPGGRIEPGDAGAADAALREACEEVGLQRAQAEPLGWLDPLLTVTGFRILPLVALVSPDFAPVADPREVAEVFEVPLDYLLADANLRRVPVEYRGRAREVLEYVPFPGVEARIWGATASILHNLTRRLAMANDAGKGHE